MEQIVESSVSKTFSSFFNFDPKLKSSQFRAASQTSRHHQSISGVMMLLQTGIQGTFSIGLNKEAALKLLSAFYGEKIESLDDPKVIEGVAEIANVTHGMIKEKLNQQGFKFKMCLPVVVVGSNHSSFTLSDSPALTMTFDSSVGEIVAEIIINKPDEEKS
jgi:CheY-specific phosphatase CheX